MVNRKYRILCAVVSVIAFWCTSAHSADLKTLMEIGASQADIAKTLREQTKIYDGVKSAVDAGAIKKGMTSDVVRRKYGEPVINVYDKKHDASKWLYMPAESTHFKGEKIYLYFDKENKLIESEKIEQ